MKHLTDDEVVHLITNGAHVRVRTGGRTQQRLVQFCANAKGKGVGITLVVDSALSQQDLVQLAMNAPGLLTLDFVG